MCEAAAESWTLGSALAQGKNQTQILNRNERQPDTVRSPQNSVAFTWKRRAEVGMGPQGYSFLQIL